MEPAKESLETQALTDVAGDIMQGEGLPPGAKVMSKEAVEALRQSIAKKKEEEKKKETVLSEMEQQAIGEIADNIVQGESLTKEEKKVVEEVPQVKKETPKEELSPIQKEVVESMAEGVLEGEKLPPPKPEPEAKKEEKAAPKKEEGLSPLQEEAVEGIAESVLEGEKLPPPKPKEEKKIMEPEQPAPSEKTAEEKLTLDLLAESILKGESLKQQPPSVAAVEKTTVEAPVPTEAGKISSDDVKAIGPYAEEKKKALEEAFESKTTLQQAIDAYMDYQKSMKTVFDNFMAKVDNSKDVVPPGLEERNAKNIEELKKYINNYKQLTELYGKKLAAEIMSMPVFKDDQKDLGNLLASVFAEFLDFDYFFVMVQIAVWSNIVKELGFDIPVNLESLIISMATVWQHSTKYIYEDSLYELVRLIQEKSTAELQFFRYDQKGKLENMLNIAKRDGNKTVVKTLEYLVENNIASNFPDPGHSVDKFWLKRADLCGLRKTYDKLLGYCKNLSKVAAGKKEYIKNMIVEMQQNIEASLKVAKPPENCDPDKFQAIVKHMNDLVNNLKLRYTQAFEKKELEEVKKFAEEQKNPALECVEKCKPDKSMETVEELAKKYLDFFVTSYSKIHTILLISPSATEAERIEVGSMLKEIFDIYRNALTAYLDLIQKEVLLDKFNLRSLLGIFYSDLSEVNVNTMKGIVQCVVWMAYVRRFDKKAMDKQNPPVIFSIAKEFLAALLKVGRMEFGDNAFANGFFQMAEELSQLSVTIVDLDLATAKKKKLFKQIANSQSDFYKELYGYMSSALNSLDVVRKELKRQALICSKQWGNMLDKLWTLLDTFRTVYSSKDLNKMLETMKAISDFKNEATELKPLITCPPDFDYIGSYDYMFDLCEQMYSMLEQRHNTLTSKQVPPPAAVPQVESSMSAEVEPGPCPACDSSNIVIEKDQGYQEEHEQKEPETVQFPVDDSSCAEVEPPLPGTLYLNPSSDFDMITRNFNFKSFNLPSNPCPISPSSMKTIDVELPIRSSSIKIYRMDLLKFLVHTCEQKLGLPKTNFGKFPSNMNMYELLLALSNTMNCGYAFVPATQVEDGPIVVNPSNVSAPMFLDATLPEFLEGKCPGAYIYTVILSNYNRDFALQKVSGVMYLRDGTRHVFGDPTDFSASSAVHVPSLTRIKNSILAGSGSLEDLCNAFEKSMQTPEDMRGSDYPAPSFGESSLVFPSSFGDEFLLDYASKQPLPFKVTLTPEMRAKAKKWVEESSAEDYKNVQRIALYSYMWMDPQLVLPFNKDEIRRWKSIGSQMGDRKHKHTFVVLVTAMILAGLFHPALNVYYYINNIPDLISGFSTKRFYFVRYPYSIYVINPIYFQLLQNGKYLKFPKKMGEKDFWIKAKEVLDKEGLF